MPKITIPKDLANICTINKYERILHTFGQSQPDSIRTFQSDFKHAPDVISYPQNEMDLVKLFEYCDKTNTLKFLDGKFRMLRDELYRNVYPSL